MLGTTPSALWKLWGKAYTLSCVVDVNQGDMLVNLMSLIETKVARQDS